jgi:hypothetical protein
VEYFTTICFQRKILLSNESPFPSIYIKQIIRSPLKKVVNIKTKASLEYLLFSLAKKSKVYLSHDSPINFKDVKIRHFNFFKVKKVQLFDER